MATTHTPGVTGEVIRTAGDARALRRSAAVWRPFGLPQVVVEIETLPPQVRTRWSRRLGFWASACGCHTGALFAIAAIVACAIDPPGTWGPSWQAVLASVGTVLLAALVGKLAGLAAARVMLVLDLERLSRLASARTTRPLEV